MEVPFHCRNGLCLTTSSDCNYQVIPRTERTLLTLPEHREVHPVTGAQQVQMEQIGKSHSITAGIVSLETANYS